MRIALISRELYPFSGGGIAPVVAAEARLLRELGDVVIVTSATHRAEYERLRQAGDPRLPPSDVELLFVEEPPGHDHGAFMSWMHAWSARIHGALRDRFGDRGPDLMEFCDYLAEGFVTIQDAHSRAAWLDRTLVCVRLHTTSELCAVLDGHLPDDFSTTVTHDLERYCLRHADRLLHVGGDILETYARYYGRDQLAPGVLTPDGFFAYDAPLDEEELSRGAGEEVHLLYVGRMERRKGVQNLLRAFTALDRDDVTLSLLGADTATGPLGTSLLDQLEQMACADPRVTFLDPVPRAEVPALIARHDVMVLPSLWECWPNTAREALMLNRPVLCTPVGGLVRMAQPGRSGWLARDTSPAALTEAMEALLDDKDAARELVALGGPREVFDELSAPEHTVAGYRDLLNLPRPRARSVARPARPPLVSVVVPYFRLEDTIKDTLDSIAAQTHPSIETIIVNDGSLRREDAVLWEASRRPGVTVVTQENAGLGAARNFGIAQALGTFILPLDADDVIKPAFVERCLRALDDPAVAYATTWVEYMDEGGVTFSGEDGGYMPLGNFSRRMPQNNVAGTCSAVFRREVFDRGFRYSTDLTSYEDWMLYWELREAGLLGAIVPERLFRYRVRRASMAREFGTPQVAQLVGEMRAHMVERTTRWVAETLPTDHAPEGFPTVQR